MLVLVHDLLQLLCAHVGVVVEQLFDLVKEGVLSLACISGSRCWGATSVLLMIFWVVTFPVTYRFLDFLIWKSFIWLVLSHPMEKVGSLRSG